MTDPADPADPFADPELDAAVTTQGPLGEHVARRLVERGRARLDAGDFASAATDFQRVIGHPDANLTGAAVLGLGDVLYRANAEDQAKATWLSVTKLPENASTYVAWKRLAGVYVRANELPQAIDAYRQADRRAPADDKAEIASRLGWLAKETGNAAAASTPIDRRRGIAGIGISQLVLGATVAISLLAIYEPRLSDALLLDPARIERGQWYRLFTVTLVHANALHLFLNMFALWQVGPMVEAIWGRRAFLLFYVLTAIGGSTGSFLFSNSRSVGASGAIFGLVGVIIAGTLTHHRMLHPRARSIIPQLAGFVVISLAIGLVSQVGGIRIDNAAHIGGLLAGLWLGFVVPPVTGPAAATRQASGSTSRGPIPERRSPLLVAAGVIALGGLLVAALAFGGATL